MRYIDIYICSKLTNERMNVQTFRRSEQRQTDTTLWGWYPVVHVYFVLYFTCVFFSLFLFFAWLPGAVVFALLIYLCYKNTVIYCYDKYARGQTAETGYGGLPWGDSLSSVWTHEKWRAYTTYSLHMKNVVWSGFLCWILVCVLAVGGYHAKASSQLSYYLPRVSSQ